MFNIPPQRGERLMPGTVVPFPNPEAEVPNLGVARLILDMLGEQDPVQTTDIERSLPDEPNSEMCPDDVWNRVQNLVRSHSTTTVEQFEREGGFDNNDLPPTAA